MNIFSRLPEEIIQNNILPYTYRTQSPVLLKDMKTFMYIYRKIYDIFDYIYETETDNFKDLMIKYDITCYYAESVLDRNTDSISFYKSVNLYLDSKGAIIKILGKMKPVERLKYLIKLSKGDRNPHGTINFNLLNFSNLE